MLTLAWQITIIEQLNPLRPPVARMVENLAFYVVWLVIADNICPYLANVQEQHVGAQNVLLCRQQQHFAAEVL